jgi:hypothetical protein
MNDHILAGLRAVLQRSPPCKNAYRIAKNVTKLSFLGNFRILYFYFAVT